MQRKVALALGIILLIIAISPLITRAYQLAVLGIDTTPPESLWCKWLHEESFYDLSTDSNHPGPVVYGRSGKLHIRLFDDGSGIDIYYLYIYITDPSGYCPGARLTERIEQTDTEAEYEATMLFNLKGKYIISFTAVDKAGNTKEYFYYAIAGVPNGDFYINDVKMTTESELWLNTRTITFEFKATEMGSSISKVYVDIKDYATETLIATVTLTEVTEDLEWRATYTFAEDGKYLILGYITTPAGDLRKMMIGIDTGGEPIIPSAPMSIRIVIGVIGLVCIGYWAIPYLKKKGE